LLTNQLSAERTLSLLGDAADAGIESLEDVRRDGRPIFKDSHHFSRTLFGQSLMTIFDRHHFNRALASL